MTTYNHGLYVRQAMASVLEQQVDFGVELVIGEDCSTDETPAYVREAQQRHPDHVRLVTSEQNVGARNNGARTSRACIGKYVAYCEGDDYWNDPTKLAQQVAFLESNPDYSMVHSHCNRYYVLKKRMVRNSLTVPSGLDDANAYEDIMLGRRSPLTVSVVTRRDLLFRIVEDCPECTDPVWPMGDTQRWLELSRLGKVACIHEPLATTNVLPESAGQSQDPRKHLRFYLKARELKLHYLKKYPINPQLARVVREKQALILLQLAFAAGDTAVAEEMYSDYCAHCENPIPRAKWLVWGSQSATRRRLVQPLVQADRRWRNLGIRLNRS
jgi:glycosyltransferase involved in cell wall biosynthesis